MDKFKTGDKVVMKKFIAFANGKMYPKSMWSTKQPYKRMIKNKEPLIIEKIRDESYNGFNIVIEGHDDYFHEDELEFQDINWRKEL